MENYIQDSFTAGIIRPSTSPVDAGFFFVGKKDGTLRPCIDFGGLNNITVKNKYPLPLISSAFAPLYGATMFSKLDLCIPLYLHQGDKWKMAFNAPTEWPAPANRKMLKCFLGFAQRLQRAHEQ